MNFKTARVPKSPLWRFPSMRRYITLSASSFLPLPHPLFPFLPRFADHFFPRPHEFLPVTVYTLNPRGKHSSVSFRPPFSPPSVLWFSLPFLSCSNGQYGFFYRKTLSLSTGLLFRRYSALKYLITSRSRSLSPLLPIYDTVFATPIAE